MKIGTLVRDRALLPKLPARATFTQEADRAARREFLLRRARIALTANPSWKGSDPDEVKDANVAALKSLLATEVAAAAAKVATLRTAMGDTTKTELVGIDDASIDAPMAAAGKKARFSEQYAKSIFRGPKQLRASAIATVSWTTLADVPTTTDADLHTLVSRRLMTAERMLWYVGKPGRDRPWKKTAGKWNGKDGWRRMFEYPRLPVMNPFTGTCNASSGSDLCDRTGNMAGWEKQFGGQFRHELETNPTADPLWTGPRLRFRIANSVDAALGAVYASAADPIDRFRVTAAKVSGDGARELLVELIAGDGLARSSGTLNKISGSGDATITRSSSRFEGFFFEKTPASNHPADAVLDLFEASDDYRARNLLMCDHVIQCLHLEALVRVKSKRDGNRTWFKTLVAAESDGWLRILHPASRRVAFLGNDLETRFFEHPKIKVEDLKVGDHVIVFNHPAYDKAKESVDVWRLENALVVAVSPRLLLQGHGTPPLVFTSVRTVPTKGSKKEMEPSMRLTMLGLFNKKLRQLRKAAIDENAKPVPRIVVNDFDSDAVLVQRTDVGPYSGYDPNDFSAAARPFARWWIQWDQDDEQNEPTIAADTDWARWVWNTQKVELTNGFGYFPLWVPRTNRNDQPIRNSAGKIKLVKEVFVRQLMAPGWNWYYEKNEPATITGTQVSARRPKVS